MGEFFVTVRRRNNPRRTLSAAQEAGFSRSAPIPPDELAL